MRHLYIIGNGFDIHHNIKSGYKDFYKWLCKNEHDALFAIDDIFGYCDSNWWKHFEENLASANTLEIALEEAKDNYPDFGSDDFHDGDWFDAEYAVEQKLEEAYSQIRDAFAEWVNQLPYGDKNKKVRLKKKDSLFLNFNYSLTLEKLYNIQDNQILHIHGKVGDGNQLVLGHGKSQQELEDIMREDEPPIFEYDEGDDFIVSRAKGAAIEGVYNQRKKTNEIIRKYENWFKSLHDVMYIHFYGHSFANVDLPYFRKIFASVDLKNLKIEANAHSCEDRRAITSFMRSQGFGNYKIISLEDVMISNHLCWRFADLLGL